MKKNVNNGRADMTENEFRELIQREYDKEVKNIISEANSQPDNPVLLSKETEERLFEEIQKKALSKGFFHTNDSNEE